MSEQRAPMWLGTTAAEDPARYLRYLAESLCYGLWYCDRDAHAQANWWAKFRRFTDEMQIADVECRGVSFYDEVKAVLSSENPSALAWARACIAEGLADAVDYEDPGSVISRLYWPARSDGAAKTMWESMEARAGIEPA